jgi:hypothetical protein
MKQAALVIGCISWLGLSGCADPLFLDIVTAPVGIIVGIHEEIGKAQSRREDEELRKREQELRERNLSHELRTK